MTARAVPCGDAALTLHFDDRASAALTRRIAALHARLGAETPPGFVESIPGLTSLTVLFDPAVTNADALARSLRERVPTIDDAAFAPRQWRIPVCYEADLAPDLEHVAASCGLSARAVIEAHSTRGYVVYLIGFSPGFPYMGDIDPALVLPRRADPRPRVPAGAVAIASDYTAIYPQTTAGGWHLIGRTCVCLFDATAARPALLAAGDSVRFDPVERSEFDALVRDYAAGRQLEPQ